MFLISSEGECESCKDKAKEKEVIECRHCDKKFHALCNISDKSNKICNTTFFGLYLTTKPNFKWSCDECLTREEENKASSLHDQMVLLTRSVQNLEKKVNTPDEQIREAVKQQVTKEFADVKSSLLEKNEECKEKFMEAVRSQVSEELKHLTTAVKDHPKPELGTVWDNTVKVDNIRSSLMLKPDSDGNPMDIKEVKKIVVDNGIPVNSIKVSSKGETFVNLPDKSSRDKLTPLLQSQETFEVVTVKSKLPTISL